MIERLIRGIAGSLILISIGLALWINPYWILLTAFVGFNLLQSSITRFCPLEYFLRKWCTTKPSKQK